MRRFEGRVALVSGAASGIGAAVAHRLEEEGATVVRSDLVETEGGVVCDVSDPLQCADAVRAVLTAHGALDVVANVAGIGFSRRIGEVTPEEWRRVIDVNLTGNVPPVPGRAARLARGARGHCEHGFGGRLARHALQRGLLRLQGRSDHADQVHGPRTGTPGSTGQCGVPGLGRHTVPAAASSSLRGPTWHCSPARRHPWAV